MVEVMGVNKRTAYEGLLCLHPHGDLYYLRGT